MERCWFCCWFTVFSCSGRVEAWSWAEQGRLLNTVEMERVLVENFLVVRRVDLEVKPFTVLIGDNAEGKSVLAKVLFLLREALLYLLAYPLFGDEQLAEVYREEILLKIRRWWQEAFAVPYTTLGRGTIRYFFGQKPVLEIVLGEHDIDGIQVHENNLVAIFGEHLGESQAIIGLLKDTLHKIVEAEAMSSEETMKRFVRALLTSLEGTVIGRLGSHSVYIPHSRALYLYSEALTLVPDRVVADPFLRHFIRELSVIAKEVVLQFGRRRMDEDLYRAYLRREFRLLRGRIEAGDERHVPVVVESARTGARTPDFLSSGQQELLPILLSLRKALMKREESVSFIIEEPEAHLFPARQVDLIYLLAFVQNMVGARFFVTTHSPYILSAVNNLLLARQEYEQSKSEQLKESYGDIWLEPQSVAVYELKSGSVRNLMGEDGLIEANTIDAVMEDISDEINKILALSNGR